MTTKNPMGFCPNCKQNVLLTREPINTMLAIILFCCTFGIGFFIYLIIYYSKSEDRCIHCNTRITALLNQDLQSSGQLPYQQQAQSYQHGGTIEGVKAKYCPLCGENLNNQSQNFCPSCGSKV